jgi:hypothetical protein
MRIKIRIENENWELKWKMGNESGKGKLKNVMGNGKSYNLFGVEMKKRYAIAYVKSPIG